LLREIKDLEAKVFRRRKTFEQYRQYTIIFYKYDELIRSESHTSSIDDVVSISNTAHPLLHILS